MRPIPKSGELLPAVGYGTNIIKATLGDPAAMAKRREVLKTLFGEGGSVIDTGATWGEAEEVVGTVLADLNARSKAFICTRAEGTTLKEVTEFKNASLRKLRTDKLDLTLAMNLEAVRPRLRAMHSWKDRGEVRYIGIAHARPKVQEDLVDWMKSEPLDFVQVNYSLWNREAENRLLPLAADKGIAVGVNLPLGKGRMLEILKAERLPEWASDVGAGTWAQLLLKFVLSHPAVTVVVPNTSKPKHMAENVAAARGKILDAAQRAQLVKIWDRSCDSACQTGLL